MGASNISLRLPRPRMPLWVGVLQVRLDGSYNLSERPSSKTKPRTVELSMLAAVPV